MVNKYLEKNPLLAKSLLMALLALLSLLLSLKLISVRADIIEEKKSLAFEEGELAMLDRIVADKEALEPRIEDALSTLPKTYFDVGELAYKIESLANSNNLETALSFDEEAVDEGKSLSLSISLETKGGYQNYTNFISGLNNLPYNTGFEQITVSSEEGLNQLTVIEVYIQK